jgi:hypothetical protein
LIVLFSKDSDTRLNAREKFEYNGTHTTKETGTMLALEDVAQLLGRLHTIALRLRVKLALIRRE